MLRVFIREIVLFLCLTVFPPVLVLLLIYTGTLPAGLLYFVFDMCLGSQGITGIMLALWLRFVPLYLLVQAIRAYLWGQRSLSGRRWGYLYFCVVSTLVGAWSLWQAWDLFYFMYELGDIPAELLQFAQLESFNLLMAVLSFGVAVYFLLLVLNPNRKGPNGITQPRQ